MTIDQIAVMEPPVPHSFGGGSLDPAAFAARQLSVDDRRAAIKRVLGSASFAKANRLHAFLEYVCRLTLAGREEEINELNIGINVFERRENYNASDDTIVRTTARLLRQRLKSYYETEGRAEMIRIEIPRGAYVPSFLAVNSEVVEPAVDLKIHPAPLVVTQEQQLPGELARHRFRSIALLLVAALVGAALTLAWVAPHRFFPSHTHAVGKTLGSSVPQGAQYAVRSRRHDPAHV